MSFQLVGSRRILSTLYDHCEAIVHFEKLVANRVKGHYRSKKDRM